MDDCNADMPLPGPGLIIGSDSSMDDCNAAVTVKAGGEVSRSDSSMDDCNEGWRSQKNENEDVQIPLWTIVTRQSGGHRGLLISSDSSMDDCNPG